MIETDLEFTINPEAIRKAIEPFIKERPEIWMFHLVGLCYQLGPTIALEFRGEKNRWEVTLGPLNEEQSGHLSNAAVQSANPLDSGLSGQMARVLLEIEIRFSPPSYHSDDHARISFTRTLARYQQKELAFHYGVAVSSGTFFLPGELSFSKGQSCSPVWVKPWHDGSGVSDDSLVGYWCDYEAIDLDPNGFPWQISGVAIPCEPHPNVVYHPLNKQDRGFCISTIFAHYPPNVLSQLSASDLDGLQTWRVRRVLGVFWGLIQRFPAQIRPVIHGCLADPIFVEALPQGFQIYSDASHLSTDLSGLRLVENDAYQQWIGDNTAWALKHLAIYIDLFDKVRDHLWMQVKPTPDWLQKHAQQQERTFATIRVIHRVVGEDRLRRKRKETLKKHLLA